MSRFSSDTVERVKQSADIVEIVSAHTDLRRQGARFSGLCPFHDERTPSFSVDPAEKLYYCFGCGAGGDVFRFVQEKEGLGFPEAVETLAERYGVEIEHEDEDPRAEAARKRRGRLGELLERTASFYSGFLWDSPKAEKAREYLAGRGLKEGVLRSFGVGFAPSAWDQVLTRGQRAGYSEAEMRDAGLIQRGQKGGFYDRFRARIVFPIRDQRGRVQGFGARGLSADAKPKYLNSPESELYRKSRTLYGIDVARGAIAKAGRAIVVEGYTDVLALHQAGFEESVAIMGTAITPDQIAILSGHAEELVLALDADRAGRDAMLRAQTVAGPRKMRLRVAGMPAGEDPAEMLARPDGPDAFKALVDAAVDLPEFEVTATLDAADLGSASGRDRALDEVVPVLAAMGDTVSREELMRTVAERIDTDPSLVARRVRGEAQGGARAGAAAGNGDGGGSSASAGATGGQASGQTALASHERRERALLAMCIGSPDHGQDVIERLQPELLSPAGGKALAWLKEHLGDPMAGLPREDEELVSLITQLKMTAEREPASPEAMELNLLLLQQHLLDRQIAEAVSGGEDERWRELSQSRAKLLERIAGRGEQT
ncbi:MAG: primase [Solirubrobacterales bacterium]|nr:primase [Solirubrobacterales bacterium]